MVELPYTLPQDHTLIHLLHRSPLQVWTDKARWIRSMGGMILTLVHPDYCGFGRNFENYEALLKRINDFESAWRALPPPRSLNGGGSATGCGLPLPGI